MGMIFCNHVFNRIFQKSIALLNDAVRIEKQSEKLLEKKRQ